MYRTILGPAKFPLGFGCVQLTSHPTEAEAVATLEHAFSLGITHFDVARAYGFGRAEGVLAKFLCGRRQQVTVATKFGLQPPVGIAGNARLIKIVKRILRPFPFLLQRARQQAATLGKSGIFDADMAIQSVETSLRELQTDYIDLLLLHEATLANAANDSLLEALEKLRAKGAVRHFGIASDFAKLHGDVRALSPMFEIVQFNEDARNRNLQKLGGLDQRLAITYSVLLPAKALQRAAQAHPEMARETSHKINADLTDPGVIAGLLLSYALRSNSGGIVLFSSTNDRHIEVNVREAESPRFNQYQLDVFATFVDQVLGASDDSLSPTNREIA